MANYYRYKLITSGGEILSGVAKLPYRETMSAVNHLERDGSITLFVKKLGRFGQSFRSVIDMRPQRRLPRIVIAEILNNLALMLRAGMPLVTALQETATSEEYPMVARNFDEMIERIQGGAGFSEAAERYPHIFSRTVLYLMRMGEETGRLDQMLKDAAEHLQRVDRIVSDTKQALLYPVFVLSSISGGLLFWFAYVVPKIIGLFKELDVALPRITQILITISEFFEAYFAHVIGMTVGGVILLLLLRKHSQRFRKALDYVLLKLPVAKTIISASNLAFISEYFAMLFNAGIDILQCLRILKDSVGNEIYREKLGEVTRSVELGDGIAAGFKQAAVFPNFVVRMISVGENSGTLSEQLTYISEQYQRKLAVIVATIGKAIEPLILVVAGAIFAVIIIGLFLPIYDLVSKVSAL
ncbi:MAG: type II secretion system F family protein [Desulfatitalea sp.]|nr:type II secretion system F family protein [Desulfatitalea sp.]NNK02817.1 type II secretion system F family protein [Desulfatitalea sp.]